jgi:hypothetical protein
MFMNCCSLTRVRTGFGKFWKLIEVFSRAWQVLENPLSPFRAMENRGILYTNISHKII